MKLIDRAIESPRLVILGVALLCVVGVWGIFKLPKERTPRIKVPLVIVAVPNPGGSPSANETQIIRKIEEESGASLKGLKPDGGIISHALNDAAVLMFTFTESTRPEDAKRDVESLINRIKGEFPPQAQQDPGPLVKDVSFDQFPIIQVFIAGGEDGELRRRVADRLKPLIERVDGISAVDIYGGLEREIEIEVDPEKLAAYNLAYGELEGVIRAANLEIPSGSIQTGRGADQNVRTRTKLNSLDEIKQVPLSTSSDPILRDQLKTLLVAHPEQILLRDVASVRMGHKPLKSIARYGGEDATVLLAYAKNDADILNAANAVQTTVDQFIADKGDQGTRIGTCRSQAREINYMLKELGTDAWQGVALLMIVLMVVFGWRNATLIAFSLPFSIVVMAAFVWISKNTFLPDLSLNNMTLFAVILVMGEVVDGSIVAAENIYRHRELGRSPLEAAKLGIEEVRTALLASYGTTFAGYSAMFLVRGIMGEYLKLLPIVSIFSLLAALIGLFFVLPLISVYLMKAPKKVVAHLTGGLEDAGYAQQELAYAEQLIQNSRTRRFYGAILRRCLEHRWLVIALAVIITLSPIVVFATGMVGFEFFPEADSPVIEVHFELPLGSSLEKKSVAVAAQIESAVNGAVKPEEWYRPSATAERVKPVTTIGDPGKLNIRFDTQDGVGPEFGMVYVELETAENRTRTASQIRDAIRKSLPPLPGVIVKVTSPSEGPPAGSPIVVRVTGQADTTLQTLADHAEQIAKLMRGIPGTKDVTTDYRVRPELVVTPLREVAGLFDINAAQIATSVNYALEGVKVGEVDFGGRDKIDLRLRNQESSRDKLSDLTGLPLRGGMGRRATLEQVATIDRAMNPSVIEHYDRKRVVSVRSSLESGALADDVKAGLIAALRPELSASEQHALATGRSNRILESNDQFLTEFGGENQMRDDAANDLMLALVVAMLGNLIILIIKFNRFIQPLIIIFSVPLSFVGVMLAFMFCGIHFSVMAMIGLVAVSGVVVDNAILKVEFINHWRRLGVPTEKAVMFAGLLRIRPILLTTAVTVGGLLPAALNIGGGGEVWVPLAVAFIGGLSFDTVVQLLLVPVMIYTFDRPWLRRGAAPAPARQAALAT